MEMYQKKIFLREKIKKKRPLGRPRAKWKDAIEKDIMRLIDRNATIK